MLNEGSSLSKDLLKSLEKLELTKELVILRQKLNESLDLISHELSPSRPANDRKNTEGVDLPKIITNRNTIDSEVQANFKSNFRRNNTRPSVQ